MGSSWDRAAGIPWLILLAFIGHIHELGVKYLVRLIPGCQAWWVVALTGLVLDYLVTRPYDNGPPPSGRHLQG